MLVAARNRHKRKAVCIIRGTQGPRRLFRDPIGINQPSIKELTSLSTSKHNGSKLKKTERSG